jgi:sulfoxide reductase heme-binding subunit YedZ
MAMPKKSPIYTRAWIFVSGIKMMISTGSRRWLIFMLSIMPLLYIVQAVVRVQLGDWELLGPEPGKAIVHFTGTWAFNLLIATLCVTPLTRYLKWRWVMPHRRMLGLFFAFYISIHGIAYLAFLLEWHWADLATEVVERPYLLLGTIAWLFTLPLVITSTKGWQRKLKRRWKTLHQLIYVIALLAAVHYLLQIRAGWFEPVLYTAITVFLLSLRLFHKTARK